MALGFAEFSAVNLISEGSELSYIYLPEVSQLVASQESATVLECCAELLRKGIRYNKVDVLNYLNATFRYDESLPTLIKLADPTLSVSWEQYPEYLTVLRKEKSAREFKLNLLDVADKFIRDLYNTEETADAVQTILESYYRGLIINHRSLADAQEDRVTELELLKASGEDVTGTTFGFKGVDEAIGYLQPGNIMIIAARPGGGKTSMLVSSILNKLKVLDSDREFVYFVECEMLEAETVDKFNSIIAKVNSQRFRYPSKIDDKVFEIIRKNLLKGCYITNKRLTPKELAESIRNTEFTTRKKCIAVYYDYIQLLSTNRELLAQYSIDFKEIAKQIKAPIIIASQLNRDAETKATMAKNKLSDEARPTKSNLSASGQIEADADLAVALYHPYDYDKTIPKAYFEMVILKGRHTAENLFYFEQPAFQYFRQIDEARRMELIKPVDKEKGLFV